MDTSSSAYASAQSYAKRPRLVQDLRDAASGSASARAGSSYRIFPDGSLLDFSSYSFIYYFLMPSAHPFSVDDKALSNSYVQGVLGKTHKALSEFSLRAESEEDLRAVLHDVRSQMIRVVHKLQVYSSFWEVLSNEYTGLQASLHNYSSSASHKA
jgi:hypothetical protein